MSSDDMLDQVQHYRSIVATYEQLRQEINKLLMKYGGGTENMPAEDLQRYRKLAHERDEIASEMRWLEQQLLDDDNEV
ncbi:MAG: hypothetical protein Kow00117_17830 [Phototrophicales bacterium]|nr:MAG: hypothetical protein D6711_07065 [Chloroflexota bacterium]